MSTAARDRLPVTAGPAPWQEQGEIAKALAHCKDLEQTSCAALLRDGGQTRGMKFQPLPSPLHD